MTWLRRLSSQHGNEPLKPASVFAYTAAVKGLFKFGSRRGFVPTRFQYAELAANVSDTLGKNPRPAIHVDRRLPLLVAYVDGLPLPEGEARGGASPTPAGRPALTQLRYLAARYGRTDGGAGSGPVYTPRQVVLAARRLTRLGIDIGGHRQPRDCPRLHQQ